MFYHERGNNIWSKNRGAFCETQEHSPGLAWKFPSRVQSFLWQRLMPKALWVLLSFYNNSTSCIWPIMQWGTTGRASIPAPAGDDFMATSTRIDSFHKFTSSECIHRCHSYSYLETLLNFSLRNILQQWILKADYAPYKKSFYPFSICCLLNSIQFLLFLKLRWMGVWYIIRLCYTIHYFIHLNLIISADMLGQFQQHLNRRCG